MERDDILCTCMDITKGEVEDAIKGKKLTTVEQVQEETDAGTGCGSCIEDIEDLLKEINNT